MVILKHLFDFLMYQIIYKLVFEVDVMVNSNQYYCLANFETRIRFGLFLAALPATGKGLGPLGPSTYLGPTGCSQPLVG